MAKRTLVTAALPYANGSLHLGHLVEYCQADMYVRALKRMGDDALYICANDAHGTPIEVNARRQGITPEALVQGIHQEQQRDFAKFDVQFDHFSITHSDANRKLVNEFYEALRKKGDLEEREVDGNWCETDGRFLPDRFIKGTCPKCDAADQYGDVCEVCRSTFGPTELKGAKCVMCGNAPVVKKSTHIFFKLSAQEHVTFLTAWIDSGALQADVANYVRSWIDKGLMDWCISRDGPYFGFEIPERPGKYFYVWLDAPIGYAAASLEWAEEHGVAFDSLWKSDETRIEHIIGKDIVYFHTLFWPAVLRAVGYTLPSKVHVHGMLTIDGEKMSKSRGTFINASVFAEHVDPQALRFYYACKFSAGSDDLDLAFDDFVTRVNAELVNKHANLFSRAAQFLINKLDGKLGDLPFAVEAVRAEPVADDTSMLNLARRVHAHLGQVEAAYRKREFGQAMRELALVADIGNEFMQGEAPWAQLKSDPEAARLTCTFALNICHALAMYLWPVVPRFAELAASVLASDIGTMRRDKLFAERNRSIGQMQRLFDRIEPNAVAAIVEASKQSLGKVESDAKGGQGEAVVEIEVAPLKAAIDYEQFQTLDLRVGLIKAAEPVPKSKKLLRLQVDIGEAQPRQIVAGIALAYTPEQLVEKKVIVVANLAPAKLMGVESQGMVLAGGEGNHLSLLQIERDLPPGSSVR